MKKTLQSKHWLDTEGNPGGGQTYGRGFCIAWQRGPLKNIEPTVRSDTIPKKSQPNGAFVEEIIEAAIDRLEFYQEGKFKHPENEHAICMLKSAIDALNRRTRSRKKRGVEGTLNE